MSTLKRIFQGIPRLIRPSGDLRRELSDREPTMERMQEDHRLLLRILQENILPFWRTRAIDQDYGGYSLNYDIYGKLHGNKRKRFVSQARTLWTFSRLASSPYGNSEDLLIADHGFEFLKDRMWDRNDGGFFWEITPSDPETTASNKHVFALTTGLFALTQYFMVSKNPSVSILLQEILSLMESKCYDNQYGGYKEFFSRDWSTPSETDKNYLKIGKSNKSFNSHLHLMESYALYYSMTKDALAYKRLMELITIQSNCFLIKGVGAFFPEALPDWKPALPLEEFGISYGHDLENVWLLMEACNAAEMNEKLFGDLFRNICDYSFRYGFDTKLGGFFQEGKVFQTADHRDKVSWVQAETMVCCLKMYQMTGDKLYFSMFDRTLEWIHSHQADWQNGEWYERIDEKGKMMGLKAGPWKGPYHNLRGVLECMNVLSSLCKVDGRLWT